MNKAAKRILVIEDDRTLNRLICEQLRAMGYAVESTFSWNEARQALVGADPSLTLLDLKLPDADGLGCIAELSAQCPVIVLTAFSSIKNAVAAMQAGAAEYLAKPINPAELELAVARTLSVDSLRRKYEYCRTRLAPGADIGMIGTSPAFNELVRMIELVAPSDATVLIEGESGVGKELVAHSVHRLSSRANNTFVAVDCCTLQENLFESELFGHEKGSFTGADRRKQGLIEVAEGGTVFLDEIGELSPMLQAKLLRLMETGEFRRLGGTQNLMSDSRFIAATNRDLKSFSQEGGFRRDLYFRLATVVITVPSLRERSEDTGLLAQHFLSARTFQRQHEKTLSDAAVAALTGYDWPGNIRELRNVMERAILVSGDRSVIDVFDLGLPATRGAPETKPEIKTCDFGFDGEPTLEEMKEQYLRHLLRKHHGHRARIAEILGVSERNTYRLVKRYGLEDEG